MTIQEITKKFEKNPVYLTNGAGFLSKKWQCNREDIYKAKKEIKKNKNITLVSKKLPKILVFDIETSPSIAYSFQRWNVNLYIDQIIKDPIMLTWSAKWLYNTEVMSDAITVEEVKVYDDSRIVKSLWDLMDEADMVIAHYGDKFDVPMLNSRAIINGLPPFSTVTSIDTKKIASKNFKFPSNKLDALATYFGLGNKIKTDFDLWKFCLEGSDDVREKTIEKMRVYNVQDVVVLEEVYLKLRPYTKSHPNIALYIESDEMVCSNCGSNALKDTDKFYYTTVSKFPIKRCECGALTRSRVNVFNKEKRVNLGMSVGK